MLLYAVAFLFLFFYLFLIGYYWYHWQRLKVPPFAENAPDVFISVVIAARNEEKTLPLLLARLKKQTHHPSLFEVIVVDDFSNDNTGGSALPFLDERVKLIHPLSPPPLSSKKKAIEAGVNAAKGELIVITDADCLPGPDWLKSYAHFYKQAKPAFIAAPVKYVYANTLVQVFQALDFMVLQGITGAGVGASFHSMCNGANLAYTKEAFVRVNGFAGIDKVASGDDMLLMHKIEKQYRGRVSYLKKKEAIVTTPALPTWKGFIQQRRRWASKTFVYDDYRVMGVLGFVYLFNCLFFIFLAAGFFNAQYWLLALYYLLAKTVIEFPFVYAVALFYKETRLLPYFILFQPLHILYTVGIGPLSQMGSYEWKGRQTK